MNFVQLDLPVIFIWFYRDLCSLLVFYLAFMQLVLPFTSLCGNDVENVLSSTHLNDFLVYMRMGKLITTSK